ncbi:MAG: hypothetical protein M5U26_10805 [Planctomycetota bacterium]|nr:hypothetical protein [Planctomycetota bacterium]
MTHAREASPGRAWWPLVPLLPALGLGLWVSGEFALWALAAIGFPYELDYGEGPILAQMRAEARGERVYAPLAEAPYTVANYPPLFRWCARAAAPLTGDYLSAGRLVSACATFLSALAVGALVFAHAWRARAGDEPGAAEPPGDPTAKLALALVLGAAAGLAALAPTFVFLWGVLLRVDALALAFALSGLAVAGCFPRRAVWALPLLLAGLFTKQSALAAPAAVCLALALRERRRGVLLAAALAGSGLLLYGLGVALTGGAFHENLVTANRNRFEWSRVAQYAGLLWADQRPILLLGLVSALELLRRQARAPEPLRGLALLYYAAAVLVSFAVGKVGSNVNYFLDLLAASALAAGLLLAELLGAWAAARGTRASALAGALAALLLAGHAYRNEHLELLARLEDELERRAPEEARLVERLKAAGGPVLSEDLVLLAQAGQPVHFQPFEMTQLAAQGLWDPAPLLDEVHAGRFAVVLLKFDLAEEAGWRRERFAPELLATLRARYREAERIGRYVLYRPKG